jgi:UDP-glucose 4-epimerase
MKVAITGASGFVGQNLHRTLSTNGIEVKALSRPRFNLNNVQENTVKLKDVDVVVHCAASVHQMKSSKLKSASNFKNVNVLGTQNILTSSNRAGVKQFIFLSTIKVNGESTHGNAFCEQDNPNPIDLYAKSKFDAEQIIMQQALMPYTIIRPPLIHGPGMKGNMPKLINLVNKPLLLPFGSIKNKRSMLHVFNLCSFIERCLLNSNAFQQLFLLCDDQSYSTPELIEQLKRRYNGRVQNLPFSVGFLKILAKLTGKQQVIQRLTESLVVSNDKAKNLIDWAPKQLL